MPTYAETSYSSLYILISDALISTKQGDEEQANKAIEEFAHNWTMITSDQKEAKAEVDDALSHVFQSSSQEEKITAVTQLSKSLSRLEKLENPVDKVAEREQFASKFTPFMEQFEAALETKDTEKVLKAYGVLNGKWNQYEQPVREQSVGMYGQIESQLAFIRITLAAEEPDLTLAASQYADFKTSVEQFLAGERVEVKKGEYSLQTLVDLINQALGEIKKENYEAASGKLTEFIVIWPNVEMEVSTRNSQLYTELESVMPILVSELSKDSGDVEKVNDQLSRFQTEIQLLQKDSHYTIWDAAFILLREGLEALLIIMVLVSFLKKSNQQHMVRWIYGGAGAGVVLSAIAAVMMSVAFQSLDVQTGREMLEGYIGLAAAVMMIGVGIWLHNKSSITSWNQYLSKQMGNAISKQSIFAMASISFLSVFREGAETLIFYAGVAPKMEISDFLIGIVVAMAILVVLAFILMKMSTRMMIQPFFLVATVLIYILAFKIIGSSIHTLQLTNEIPTHVLHNLPVIHLIAFLPDC